MLRPFVGVGAISVVVVFLAVGSDQLKALIQRWVDACVVVIEHGDPSLDKSTKTTGVPIKLHVVGSSSVGTVIYFETSERVMKSVKWARNPKTKDPKESASTFHFYSNEFCPKSSAAGEAHCGDSSPSSAKAELFNKIGWRMSGFESVMDYQFEVTIDSTASSSAVPIWVYSVVQKPDVSANSICRFENRSFWNWLITQSAWVKAATASIFVFILALLGALFARWRDDSKSEKHHCNYRNRSRIRQWRRERRRTKGRI